MPLTRLFKILFSFCVLSSSNSLALHLRLEFNHMVNGKPLLLDSLRYANSADETFSISRLSYLLSEFALQAEDGQWVSIPNSYAYIDASKKRQYVLFRGLPNRYYTAIRFSVGLNSKINHSNPAQYDANHPLNPNLNNLHWDWQTGYIFLALEGRYRTPDHSPSGFVYHFANDAQRTSVTIALPEDLRMNSILDIDFDIGALLNAPASISFVEMGASTHSRKDDPIPLALKTNLPSAFQLKRIQTQLTLETKNRLQPIDLPEAYTPHPFTMSARFPIPSLPQDNPLIKERVELGERLFHDPILSANNRISCSSCHKDRFANSDQRKKSIGIRRQQTVRHSMPIFNLAWKEHFFWDGRSSSLREQALIPIEDPTEMGERLPRVIGKLKASEDYPELFTKAFDSGTINAENIGLALENFMLAETSYNSKFDQAVAGKTSLSTLEQRGLELFMTEFEPRSKQYGADCFHCHGGALFTDNRFHDNGLAMIGRDRGLFQTTKNSSDQNKFSTPSLRNVAITAPYMHDGRFETLEEVVEHYSTGIHRRDTLDPNLAKHPSGGLQLSTEDKAALVAFLRTLTDPKYLRR
ncbi:MAG: MbnP family protein [Verrucomicrobiota bacterium]